MNDELLKAILYRDGKPVVDRPEEEVAAIFLNHTKPGHPDENPNGVTAGASSPIAHSFFGAAIEERRKKRQAGKLRAFVARENAEIAARPIYEEYKKQIESGVKPRKAIGATFEALTRSARFNGLDIRQIRRAVRRMIEKDKS